MDTATYLARIGYKGSTRPSLENLEEMHRCHVLSVPFGSLAIHSGEKIVLDIPALYQKIVGQHRGGFCYEVNGMFSWLLEELGYEVTRLSGQVRNTFTQMFGPPYDHLVFLVDLDGRRWLCDVGYGSAFRTPLLLEAETEQARDNGVFRLCEDKGVWFLQSFTMDTGSQDACKAWVTLYKFTLDEQKLEDFARMCDYHQTSPSSIFFCKSFCSLHLPNGQVTYMGRRLITTEFGGGGVRKITRELEESQIPKVLKESFGITLRNQLIPKDNDIVPPLLEY